jgi:hypothetical protein
LYLPMHLQIRLLVGEIEANQIRMCNVFPVSRPVAWLRFPEIAGASIRATAIKAIGHNHG